jgi:hypothetical protein
MLGTTFTENVHDVAKEVLQPSFTRRDVRVILADSVRATLSKKPTDTISGVKSYEENCSTSQQHGTTLARQIWSIACGTETKAATGIKEMTVDDWVNSCPVQIDFRQALLAYDYNAHETIDDGTCGERGTPLSVANAIYQALQQWRQDVSDSVKNASVDPEAVSKVPGHLILNLSIGFEGNSGESEWIKYGGGISCNFDPENLEENQYPGERLIYDAIRLAACHGAIIVAAAGNNGNSSQSGLACPARWGWVARPSAQECEDLSSSLEGFQSTWKAFAKLKYNNEDMPLVPELKTTGDGSDTPWSDRLLLSAGAVDYAGTPLITSRTNACPDIWALGLASPFGRKRLHDSLRPAAFLSGTSVAAADVSAVAAQRWATDPAHQTRADVLDKLPYIMTGMNPVPFPKLQTGNRQYCGKPTSLCKEFRPWLSTVKSNPGSDPQNAGSEASWLWPGQPQQYGLDTSKREQDPVCPEKMSHCERPTAISPDVDPQPLAPPCDVCVVALGKDHDNVEFSALMNTELKDAALAIQDPNGKEVVTLWLGNLPSTPEGTPLKYSFKIDQSSIPKDVVALARAYLAGYGDSGNAVTEPVLVTF